LFRARKLLATERFDSYQNLEQTIARYVQVYNQHIPQKALEHIVPTQSLKDWAAKRPNCLVYNLPIFDTKTDARLRVLAD